MDENLSMVNVQPRKKNQLSAIFVSTFWKRNQLEKLCLALEEMDFQIGKKRPRNSKIIVKVISTSMQKDER